MKIIPRFSNHRTSLVSESECGGREFRKQNARPRVQKLWPHTRAGPGLVRPNCCAEQSETNLLSLGRGFANFALLERQQCSASPFVFNSRSHYICEKRPSARHGGRLDFCASVHLLEVSSNDLGLGYILV